MDLPILAMDSSLHRTKHIQGAAPDFQSHPRIYDEDHKHRYQKKHDTTELVKREFWHVRQQHCANRRISRIISRSCTVHDETQDEINNGQIYKTAILYNENK